MATDLEKRVAALEHEISDVKQVLASVSPSKRDWRRTVGTSKDDPGFAEMIALGRAIREQAEEGNS